MPDLVVHADDYGLTGSVSEGILEAHAHGLVTSTSILMTHVTPRELAWLRSEPTLDLGLHLNLSSGKPLSPLSDVPTMTRDRRVFTIPRVEDPTSPHKRFDFDEIPEQELEDELGRQVEAGLSTGFPISHLDTHHHVHRDPRIFALLMEFARRERLAVRTLTPEQRTMAAQHGVRTTAAFLGDWFGAGEITKEAFLEAVSTVGPGQTAELMCHPGNPSETLAALSSYNAERGTERALLQDPALRRALQNLGVRLIGWRDIEAVA